MTNVRIGDFVELIHAENVYDLELGKIYEISEIFDTNRGIQILVYGSETSYSLKRFRHGIKLIRKRKLEKLFSK